MYAKGTSRKLSISWLLLTLLFGEQVGMTSPEYKSRGPKAPTDVISGTAGEVSTYDRMHTVEWVPNFNIYLLMDS